MESRVINSFPAKAGPPDCVLAPNPVWAVYNARPFFL